MKSEGECPDLTVDPDLGVFERWVERLCVVGSDTSLEPVFACINFHVGNPPVGWAWSRERLWEVPTIGC